MNKLQEGRLQMRERCIEIAAKLSTHPRIRVIEPRLSLSGRAWANGKMAAPRPFTRKALYIFAHECAHFHLGHLFNGQGKPRHVEEMEAEKWAHAALREHGIRVPRTMTRRAKEYVGWKIAQARKRGAKRIDPAARQFAKRSPRY